MKEGLFALLLAAGMLMAASYVMAGERVELSPGPDGVQRAEVTGGGYYFKPEHMVVRLGVPVELTVAKEGGIVPHNFIIDSPEAGMEARVKLSTEAKTIRFTPAHTGSYPFYCDRRLLFFKSHRAKGMEGVIEVVE